LISNGINKSFLFHSYYSILVLQKYSENAYRLKKKTGNLHRVGGIVLELNKSLVV